MREWAGALAGSDLAVVKVGYFGSYARGDWGVGSDVDLVVIVRESSERFERRALAFDAGGLPVPADVLVYTAAEWQRMEVGHGLPRTIRGEVVWVFERPSD